MSKEKKRLVLALALIFAVNIFIIALAQKASADLYKKGSSGATVSEIQSRLKNWGYYSGSVDGVYGSQTEKAVRWFQQKNGLQVDGQVGDLTPSGRWCSTGWSIPLSPIRSQRSSTSPVPFRVLMTDSSTSPWPRAPTAPRRTP